MCVCVPQSSSSFQELVLVENTRLSEQYFPSVQKFVVFDLGLTLLPVNGQSEASQLIAQMVRREDVAPLNCSKTALPDLFQGPLLGLKNPPPTP